MLPHYGILTLLVGDGDEGSFGRGGRTGGSSGSGGLKIMSSGLPLSVSVK